MENSLATMVLTRVRTYGERQVMRAKRKGRWQEVSWNALGEQISKTAQGLKAMGLQAGDRLAILAENRPEWAVVDLACLFLGAVDVPLYLTSTAKDIAYILHDAGVKAVAVAGEGQLEKILQVAQELPDLKFLILFDQDLKEETRTGRLRSLSLEGLMGLADREGGEIDLASNPGLATIIYTSGTTGPPKGVMLSHANILSNCRAATEILPLNEDDLTVSFLPLSHAFERTAGLYTLLMAGGTVAYGGGTVTLTRDLPEVKPTVLCCVPRVLELIYRRVHSERESASSPKKQILSWTLDVGKRVGLHRSEGQPLPLLLSVQNRLADQILFRRLRRLLGGRIRFLVSGGAPLAAEIARFFYGVGITVYEGYGLTEAAPVISCNLPGKCRLGSVGPTLPGVEVAIAPDGEILARGPNVMQGYYQRPEETREMIDAEGWLHTGDVGKIDAEGFIHITDRKKDLIITSEGENVAPQNIETLLKQDPLIEEVCVMGDRRPYLTALIIPNLPLVETLAREQKVSTTVSEMLTHPAVRMLFRQRIDEVNKTLPLYSRVRNFTLLPQPFSQDRGELTPTLKVKRRVVAEMYQEVIEAMYPANRPLGEKQS